MLLSLRSLAVLTLVLLPLAVSGFAATFLAEGYAVRVWQTEDGLPQNLVTSAAQTRDGYLWFGTWTGLARFDGERFQAYNSTITPGLQDRRISCLFEDAQGTLWIGTESGVITRYHDGRFEPALLSSGAVGEKVIGLGSDEQGRLWAMRQNGAIDSLDQKIDRIPSLIAPALPEEMAWTRNERGNICVAQNGRAARLVDGRLSPISFPPSQQYGNAVSGIAAAADDALWILSNNRIRKWANGGWVEDRGGFPWPPGPVACGLELRDGTLAVGTIYSGLYLIFRDGRRPAHIDRRNGLPQNWVRFLYEDREGNLWVGAGTAGLASIHVTAFSVLDSPDQWQGCTVLAVAPGRDGSLWIGTDGATLYHYSAGKWQHFGADEGLPNGYIPAVTESPDGEVWLGHFWWGSPYHLKNGHFVRPASVDEKLSPVFALLAPPGTDELLVGNRDGLLQLKDDRSTWLIKAPDASAGAALAIAWDRRGGIWCGFEEGGLARLADGKLTIFHRQDGLASDSVRCLFSDDDSLWIGTADGGLSRFKNGRFANLGVAQGLVDSFIGYILADDLGYLWLSTHHGLQRIAKDELNRCADGAIPRVSGQIYDQYDGLPTIELTGGLQAAGCKTADGRLCFANNKGLLVVDPARIKPNPAIPPVVVESLLVDGNSVPFLHGSVSERLPPDHKRLEFRYSGLSFVAPNKVLFKYRLDGIDRDWIDAGSKRTAFYSRLPAGTYRFRVIACNNDGMWNTAGAALAFTVAPFFWQTWWFISACALAVLAAVAVLVRYLTRRRMQRRIEQLERAQAIERERARIAQDIHDDVGASLTRIAMLSQPARQEREQTQQTAAVLSRIYSTAGETTRALDEIVWALDPRHDTLDSLVGYMGKFAQDLLSAANIRCRLELPVEVPAWPLTAEVRHNLFLAFKEVLNNALRHAHATEVHLSLLVRSDGFVLIVKDNGRGFDPSHREAAPAGRIASGHGLLNIERRLARIGGRFEISSAAGQGTRVSFIIHAPTPATASTRHPPSHTGGRGA
jgi:signal transduction histidine kinase/ligand-binding sensor domain-containing protein